MAIRRNTAQYSLTAGTAVTTLTAGAPDAWTVLVIGGTGTVTSQDQTVPNTKEVIRVHSDATTQTYFGWTGVDAAAISCRGAFTFKTPAAFPGSSTNIHKLLSNGGGTSLGNFLINSTGRMVYISDAGGTTDTATNPLSVSTEYKALYRMRNQTGTTLDTLELEIYSATDVLVTGAGLSLTARNFGASSPGSAHWGKRTTTSTFGDIDFSYLTYETSATVFTTMLALPGSNTPPTCTAPADVYAATGTPISLLWATSDSDGTVSDLVVTQTDGPPLTLAGTGLAARTATPSTAGHRVFSAVAIDNQGAPSTAAVVVVDTYNADGSAQAKALRTNTDGFVAVGVVDFVAAVAIPADTARYIESASIPTNDVIVYDMMPVGPGNIILPITNRRQPPAGTACTLLVEILQGAGDTLVFDDTITVADTWGTTSLVLVSGELTAFNNRKIWALRLTANQ